MPKELTVVIPVYNEEEIIQEVVNDWVSTLTKMQIEYDINIYNDGSKDNTLAKLTELGRNNKSVKVIDKKNSGHGPTILRGYKQCDTEWVFQVDSDNEMRSEHFSKIWGLRQDYDLILGRRENRISPFSRKIVSFISRLTIKLFYGPGVYDVNSPYRLIRRENFVPYFKNIPENTFAPNLILAGIAAKRKFRVKEVIIPCQIRKTGEVSIKKWKLIKAALKSFSQTITFAFKL